jgi:hypothetical protein
VSCGEEQGREKTGGWRIGDRSDRREEDFVGCPTVGGMELAVEGSAGSGCKWDPNKKIDAH